MTASPSLLSPMVTKQVQFYERNVYGTSCLYPLGNEFVVAHALISGRKTLSSQQIEGYEMLGIKLKKVDDPEGEDEDTED